MSIAIFGITFCHIPEYNVIEGGIMNTDTTLDKLRAGESAAVLRINNAGSMRRRLRDIGVSEGMLIKCVSHAPLGDPHAYFIRGAVIAIRSEDSKGIDVRVCTREK